MRVGHVDLNLFILFDALYREKSLTRVAEQLALTQPAASNALARLRGALNDPLFLRTPQGMQPTPLAKSIIENVREALALFDRAIREGEVFDPALSKRKFRISMTDLAAVRLLPELLKQVSKHAPGTSIQSYYTRREELGTALRSGDIDLAVDAALVNDPDLLHVPLISERYVCLVRKGHPAADSPLSLERYLEMSHIFVSSRRRGQGHVDTELDGLGLQRKIQLRLENYASAIRIMHRTNLALTVPWGYQDATCVALEIPFQVPSMEWHLYWHKSVDADRKISWLRKQLIQVASVEDV